MSSDTTRKRRAIDPRQLDFLDEATQDVRRAAWRAVSDAGCLQELAEAIHQLRRWKCSLRTAESKVSQYLSPDGRRPLPHFLLPVISALTGSDLGVVSTQLQAVETHRRMVRAEAEYEPPRRVSALVE
jgi:hypothetical protein